MFILRRKLLEARRTEGEFETAKSTYDKTRQKLEMILETWDAKGQEQVEKSRKRLQNAYAFISRKAEVFIQSALQKVLQQWGLVDGDSNNDSTNALQRAPPKAEFANQVSVYVNLFMDQTGSMVSLKGPESDLQSSCRRVSSFEPGRT